MTAVPHYPHREFQKTMLLEGPLIDAGVALNTPVDVMFWKDGVVPLHGWGTPFSEIVIRAKRLSCTDNTFWAGDEMAQAIREGRVSVQVALVLTAHEEVQL